jgi:hypothetical protein
MISQLNFFKSFALFAIIFSLFSCGNKMTRDNAKEIICKKYNLPLTITEKLQHGKALYSMNFGGSNISAEKSLEE